MIGRIGGGYEVDPAALRTFAQIAETAAQSVEMLAQQIHAALTLGAPGGLDIGTAISQAESAWSARLTQLASEASGIGARLTANATSYNQTESDILAALTKRAGA